MPQLHERTLNVWQGKVQATVKMAGSGAPVLFFPGMAGLFWDEFLDRLSRQYTVYALEYPGTGATSPQAISQIDTLWDLVLVCEEILDALGLHGIPLIGHSFGGMLACEVAAHCPQRVTKLVLMAPLGLWREDAPITVGDWMARPLEELAHVFFYNLQSEPVRRYLATPSDPQEAGLERAQFLWALGCTAKFVWPVPDKGLKKRIHRVKAPTLVIWGQQDALIPPAYAGEFVSRIGGARLELVSEAGHTPQMEQVDHVTALVLRFVASQ
jgi:pimeloyl-ACP methyl ester carboxylesterase